MIPGHKRIKKKLIPELKINIPFQEIYYVKNILPEILYIYFVYVKLGYTDTKKLLIKISNISKSKINTTNAEYFSFISNYNKLNKQNSISVLNDLESSEKQNLQNALEDFMYYFSYQNPLSNIIKTTKITRNIEKIQDAINALINRRSEDATIIQILIMEVDIHLKNLDFINKDLVPKIDLYFKNPNSDDGKSIAARARMHLNGNYQNLNIDKSWAEYFWKNCTNIFPLTGSLPLRLSSKELPIDQLTLFSTKFSNYISLLINEIWCKIGINLFDQELYEVIGAIISRQAILALRIAENPGIWDWHVGPLVLRSMTENYITLKWILTKDSLERARNLIDYGLGQEKLYVENLKNKLNETENEEEKEHIQLMINSRIAWINRQHYVFLQDINIGSWAGKSIRQMAIEADCLDYYRFTFSPWSFCTHNSWNHISIFNTREKDSSIHNFIKEPYIFNSPPEFDILYNSFQYLEDIFKVIITNFNIEFNQITIMEWLMKNKDDLYK